MAKVRETVLMCDNPSCDTMRLHSRHEPALGIHFGRGSWHLGGGGPIPSIYACQQSCVAPAVEFVMTEAMNGG